MPDAYVSVADAEVYYTKYYTLPTAWSALTATQKDAKIRIATRYLDMLYEPRFTGIRAVSGQDLAWPRSGATDPDGYAFDATTAPQCVQDACAVAAVLEVTTTNGLYPDPSDTSQVARKKVKVGPVEQDITYIGAQDTNKTFPIVDRILTPVLVSGNRIYQG